MGGGGQHEASEQPRVDTQNRTGGGQGHRQEQRQGEEGRDQDGVGSRERVRGKGC